MLVTEQDLPPISDMLLEERLRTARRAHNQDTSAYGTKAQRHWSVQIGQHADSRVSWSCRALPVASHALLHLPKMR
eukprot:1310124-Prymnesium_polylepis.1